MLAAVLTDKKKLSLKETPLSSLEDHQVRIKVKYCGICGSDLSRYVYGLNPGLILGHEFSGVIEEIGNSVKTWKKGDRVVINPLPFCRNCYQCRSGAANLCSKALTGVGLEMPGAFAQFCTVTQDMIYSLPPNLDFASGTLVEPLAVVLRAIRRSKIAIGDSVVVFGAGPLGLMIVKCLQNMDISPLIVIEPDKSRASLVRNFGVDNVFMPDESHRFLSKSFPTKGGSDVVFECSGVPQAMNIALEVVRPGGTIVMVGVNRKPADILMLNAVTKEIILLGTLAYSTEFEQAIQLLEREFLSSKDFISDIVPLKEIDSAFSRLLSEGKPLKVLVEP